MEMCNYTTDGASLLILDIDQFFVWSLVASAAAAAATTAIMLCYALLFPSLPLSSRTQYDRDRIVNSSYLYNLNLHSMLIYNSSSSPRAGRRKHAALHSN